MKTFPVPLSPEEEADCLLRIGQGDTKAKEKLILHNMRLVAHVVKKYSSSEEDSEDLISIGTIGLLKAVSTFNSNYGSRFATYAIRCIDNEILMYLRSRRKVRGEVSLYEPVGIDKEGNQLSVFETLEHEDEDVTELIAQQNYINVIRERMTSVLDERETYIICRRYGMFGYRELTQREIAQGLHISRSYVSRIEKRALGKLRKLIMGLE